MYYIFRNNISCVFLSLTVSFCVFSLFVSIAALKKVSSFQSDRVGLVNGALPEEEGEEGEEGQLGEEGGGGEGGGGGGGGGGGKGGLLLQKRRNKLPCPTPEMADFSLWSILRKNIGTYIPPSLLPIYNTAR